MANDLSPNVAKIMYVKNVAIPVINYQISINIFSDKTQVSHRG